VTSEVPVEMWMKAGQVRANTMVLKHKLNEVTFGKGVAVRLNPSQQRRRKATKQPVSVPTLDLAGNSDAPVDIASTTMIVKDRQRSILLAGEVRVTQGPSTLTSRELEILYQPTSAKPASAKGAGQPTAQPQTNAPLAGSGDIRSARASGDVTITREGSRVIATVAHFLNLEKRVVLVGDVVVTSGTDRRILAERAEIQTETNDAVLTGRNVTLTQGKNVLRGSQATVKHATARMQLVRPGGRIAAVLAPQQKQQKKNKRRANRATKRGAAAGRALTGLAGGWTFTSDPNAPIEIGAVSLDVDDKARTAVFRGKVVARQGGVVIQTASLTASYLGGGSLLPGTSAVKQKNPLGAATKPAQEARVTHVRAANGVIITSESGQLVQGDWADFNVAANTITIGGNVRMQKGRQVVTGPKIVIDLNTGLSRVVRTNETVTIDTRKKQAAAPPAGAATRCREGRSCLVFFPGDAKASHKKTTRIPTPKPAIRPLPTAPLPATVGNSWSTISTPSN